jgi:hypothetical protein
MRPVAARPGGQGVAPINLPEGYHTPARGQSQTRTRRFRRELPPGWRMVGLRQIDGMPHIPSMQDQSLGRHRAVGR